jgi:polysaccharide export outer membrane protein
MVRYVPACRGASPTWRHRIGIRLVRAALLAVFALSLIVGCEVDSFMDPSVAGRWERTPVVLPILERLDVVDEPSSLLDGLTQVRRDDLLPDVSEYIIGPGDLITVSIFELIVPNIESVQTRRVNELGIVRLPVIGAIQAANYSPSELERRIAKVLADQDQLKDATVSVIVQEGRQRTYSIIGEPRVAGTAIGTYTIPRADFRILEAIALARGVPAEVQRLYVIRQVRIAPELDDVIGRPDDIDAAAPAEQGNDAPPAPDAVDLIDQLMQGVDDDRDAAPKQPDKAAAEVPRDLASTVQEGGRTSDGAAWVNIDGQWVRIDDQGHELPTAAAPAASMKDRGRDDPLGAMVSQRVIEVPFAKLINGDMRYNIVIRPGDVIRVPTPDSGNVYIGGAISRPGTYTLPGERELTLKQLVFSAGNFTGIAIPERVDLIRRIDGVSEATVRVNMRAIFHGEQPDIFLKANDTVNVGTNFVATPLAVLRNGFRVSYGFGFLLDRNFGGDVFGAAPDSN